MRPPRPDREDRFRALYTEVYDDVLRFAYRRTSAARAEDVAAEVFAVAWRRFEHVPPRPEEARAWLFGVARNCLLSDHRAQRRGDALAVRIAAASPTSMGAPDGLVALRLDVARAWPKLSPTDQEALSCAIFDGLSSAQAAQVLGITAVSYRLRLLRARRALRRQLEPVETLQQPVMEAQP